MTTIIFNSKPNKSTTSKSLRALSAFQNGTQRRASDMLIRKVIGMGKMEEFPEDEFLDLLSDQTSDLRTSRLSVAKRTKFAIGSTEPKIDTRKLARAFAIATGNLNGENLASELFKGEIDSLIRVALRNEHVTNGANRTVSLRKPGLGYKITVQVQSATGGEGRWRKKESQAICVTIASLRNGGEFGEKRDGDIEIARLEECPLLFGGGSACVVRYGWVGVGWAVDLDSEGGRMRMGFWRRLLCGHKERGDGVGELEKLL